MKTIFLLLLTCCFGFQLKFANAQTAASDNVLFSYKSLVLSGVISKSSLDSGEAVQGVYEGRSPCLEIAKQLNVPMTPDCIKIKWRLTLYQDPKNLKPTTYTLEGVLTDYRQKLREGKWAIVKSTKTDPEAVIYQLALAGSKRSQFFLKADDNILFFLDKDWNLMVGNADFSYTLNRVEN